MAQTMTPPYTTRPPGYTPPAKAEQKQSLGTYLSHWGGQIPGSIVPDLPASANERMRLAQLGILPLSVMKGQWEQAAVLSKAYGQPWFEQQVKHYLEVPVLVAKQRYDKFMQKSLNLRANMGWIDQDYANSIGYGGYVAQSHQTREQFEKSGGVVETDAEGNNKYIDAQGNVLTELPELPQKQRWVEGQQGNWLHEQAVRLLRRRMNFEQETGWKWTDFIEYVTEGTGVIADAYKEVDQWAGVAGSPEQKYAGMGRMYKAYDDKIERFESLLWEMAYPTAIAYLDENQFATYMQSYEQWKDARYRGEPWKFNVYDYLSASGFLEPIAPVSLEEALQLGAVDYGTVLSADDTWVAETWNLPEGSTITVEPPPGSVATLAEEPAVETPPPEVTPTEVIPTPAPPSVETPVLPPVNSGVYDYYSQYLYTAGGVKSGIENIARELRDLIDAVEQGREVVWGEGMSLDTAETLLSQIEGIMGHAVSPTPTPAPTAEAAPTVTPTGEVAPTVTPTPPTYIPPYAEKNEYQIILTEKSGEQTVINPDDYIERDWSQPQWLDYKTLQTYGFVFDVSLAPEQEKIAEQWQYQVQADDDGVLHIISQIDPEGVVYKYDIEGTLLSVDLPGTEAIDFTGAEWETYQADQQVTIDKWYAFQEAFNRWLQETRAGEHRIFAHSIDSPLYQEAMELGTWISNEWSHEYDVQTDEGFQNYFERDSWHLAMNIKKMGDTPLTRDFLTTFFGMNENDINKFFGEPYQWTLPTALRGVADFFGLADSEGHWNPTLQYIVGGHSGEGGLMVVLGPVGEAFGTVDDFFRYNMAYLSGGIAKNWVGAELSTPAQHFMDTYEKHTQPGNPFGYIGSQEVHEAYNAAMPAAWRIPVEVMNPFFWVIPTAGATRGGLKSISTAWEATTVTGATARTLWAGLSPIAGVEWAVAKGLKYSIGVPLKYGSRAIRTPSRMLGEMAVDITLNRWLLSRGLTGTKGFEVVAGFLRGHYKDFVSRFNRNFGVAMEKGGREAENAVKAADQTIKEMTPELEKVAEAVSKPPKQIKTFTQLQSMAEQKGYKVQKIRPGGKGKARYVIDGGGKGDYVIADNLQEAANFLHSRSKTGYHGADKVERMMDLLDKSSLTAEESAELKALSHDLGGQATAGVARDTAVRQSAKNTPKGGAAIKTPKEIKVKPEQTKKEALNELRGAESMTVAENNAARAATSCQKKLAQGGTYTDGCEAIAKEMTSLKELTGMTLDEAALKFIDDVPKIEQALTKRITQLEEIVQAHAHIKTKITRMESLAARRQVKQIETEIRNLQRTYDKMVNKRALNTEDAVALGIALRRVC